VKKSTTAKRRTPTKVRTPVIAGRVPESLHRQIKQAAKASGRSISDELAWLAASAVEWQRAFGDTRKLLADAQRSIGGQLRQAMRDAGFTHYSGPDGSYWMEPGSQPMQLALGPELKAAIADAVKQAITEAKEESK
jgi:hypothetical protein